MISGTAPPAAAAPAGDTHVAQDFLRHQTVGGRIQSVLHRHPALSPAVVLVLSIVVFGVLNDRFLRPENLSLVTQQVAVVGALAVGQTLIILTAGIDLSVGAVMVLGSMVMAQTATANGVPGVLALGLGLVVGLAAGAVNGFLVTKVKLPPFIVTLGTLNVFLALTLLYSRGATVRGADLPAILTWTGQAFNVGGVRITAGVLLMLALYAVIAYALGRTAWGRHVYAVGDDKEAASLAGIKVGRVLMSVYVTAGAAFALAGWILVGRINAASPNAGADANLDSITAVVIGGTSLFGGRGIVWGSLLGALIVGVFRNGLSLAGVDQLYQTLTVGLLVIVAVSVDQWIRKGRA
ncbi:ABC transporter permease [Cellulomonas sp. APG4]|uniref:ABC transporter permease n=1 Tax=Cellulomonas sp. APG4 TaxID=1538656 RepID=UPI00137A9E3A|nr:ABC transporter permease [Cellulomonas sp. APG4]NCT92473.1 ABC transporter permease [Cellulomonas sp. APG4]